MFAEMRDVFDERVSVCVFQRLWQQLPVVLLKVKVYFLNALNSDCRQDVELMKEMMCLVC